MRGPIPPSIFQMSDDDYRHPTPPNSYSRMLDSRVQESELPYGYLDGEPSADTHDFDQMRIESAKKYHKKM